MNTILKLYRTQLVKERNMAVDSLQDYLDSCPKLEVESFTPLKVAPTLDIKVSLNQEMLYDRGLLYNYCSFTTDDREARTIYFFIDSLEWVAEQTLRLRLTLDVINLYAPSITAGNSLSSRTLISREHRSRFNLQGYAKIDRIPEGMDYPKEKIIDDVIDGDFKPSWTLTYVADSTDESSPIVTTIYPTEETSLGVRCFGSTFTIQTSNFPAGRIILITKDENNAKSAPDIYNIEGGQTINTEYPLGYRMFDSATSRYINLLAFSFYLYSKTSTHQNFRVEQLWYYDDLTFAKRVIDNVMPGLITPNKLFIKRGGIFHYTDYVSDELMPSGLQEILSLPAVKDNYATSTIEHLSLRADSEIDRTDIRLLKMMTLPYPPFAYDNQTGEVTEGFTYIDGRLVQNTATPKMESDIIYPLPFQFTDEEIPSVNPDYIRRNDPYKLDNETKLLSSEFCNLKFVYDSFVYEWKMENVPIIPEESDEVKFTFKASSSMLSQFLFNFTSTYAPSDENLWIEDYPHILVVNTNNERAIYTSRYLDYLRNGYNYDQKRMTLENSTAGLNLLTSVVNNVSGMIANGVTPGSFTSIASSSWTYGAGTYSRNLAFQQNIRNLQEQGANITGASDFDLVSYYTKNRLKFVYYKINRDFQSRVQQFLRLYGYNTAGEQKKPNPTNRIWFDYLQCTPDFGTAQGSNIPLPYREILSSKLQEGVTFFHTNTIEGVKTWDFDQQYENYERELFL